MNLNFDKSYLTKASQKPLYKTRFMLDELGNLQSEGHGIQNFQTMLSIGLGQDQQFTLILQTLQQLRDVYGDAVDKVVQGNTSNIVFLKSTDDAMLDTLQKMSGTTHRAFIDGKTITRDLEKLFLKNEGKVSYNMSIREMPVISYNDMAFISERNSIVSRAGDSPIWNRNETILPMSWRLFSNTIVQPGKEYSLQTVPTLSSALEFDVRKNQPDFVKMWEKRKRQAMVAGECREAYMSAYGFNDYDMEQLDPDIAADEIMDVINTYIQELNGGEDGDLDTFEGDDELWNHMEENLEQIEIVQAMKKEQSVRDDKRFGGGLVSPSDLVANGGSVSHNLDYAISEAFNECKDYFWKDSRNFKPNTGDGKLYGIKGELFISPVEFVQDLQELNMAGKDVSSPVYSERPVDMGEVRDSYVIHNAFIKFLASCSTWNDFASGKFESEMKRVLSDDMIQ